MRSLIIDLREKPATVAFRSGLALVLLLCVTGLAVVRDGRFPQPSTTISTWVPVSSTQLAALQRAKEFAYRVLGTSDFHIWGATAVVQNATRAAVSAFVASAVQVERVQSHLELDPTIVSRANPVAAAWIARTAQPACAQSFGNNIDFEAGTADYLVFDFHEQLPGDGNSDVNSWVMDFETWCHGADVYSCYSSTMLGIEARRLLSDDAPLLLASFVLQLGCMGSVFWGMPPSGLSRWRSSLLGMLACFVVLAVALLGFNIAVLTVGYNPLALLVPFCVLSVGVDDAILFVGEWCRHTGRASDDQEPMAQTMPRFMNMAALGGSTSAAAFFWGAATVGVPGVRQMAFFAGCGFVLVFVFMTTLFPAIVGAAVRRPRDDRSFSEIQLLPTVPAKWGGGSRAAPRETAHARRRAGGGGGTAAAVAVLAVTLAWVGVSAWGVRSRLQVGAPMSDLLPSSSVFHEHQAKMAKAMGYTSEQLMVVPESSASFGDRERALRALWSVVEATPCFSLMCPTELERELNATNALAGLQTAGAPDAEIATVLLQYVAESGRPHDAAAFVRLFETALAAAQMHALFDIAARRPFVTSVAYSCSVDAQVGHFGGLRTRLDAAAPVSRAASGSRFFSKVAMIAEANTAIWRLATETMLSGVCILFVVCMLNGLGTEKSIIACVVAAGLDTTLLGAMAWGGIPLDFVAMLTLVVAVGVSIDFTLHVLVNAELRCVHSAGAVLRTVGRDVLLSASCTLIGLAPLAASVAPVLRRMHVVLSGIFATGLVWGLCVAPALLRIRAALAAA